MNDGAFINSKVTLEIKNKNEDIFLIPNNYVGHVPEWVTKSWLFKACCNDGTITFLGNNKKLKDSDEEKRFEELYNKANSLGIKVSRTMKPETILKKIEEQENKEQEEQIHNDDQVSEQAGE